jgi:hypothetical protein
MFCATTQWRGVESTVLAGYPDQRSSETMHARPRDETPDRVMRTARPHAACSRVNSDHPTAGRARRDGVDCRTRERRAWPVVAGRMARRLSELAPAPRFGGPRHAPRATVHPASTGPAGAIAEATSPLATLGDPRRKVRKIALRKIGTVVSERSWDRSDSVAFADAGELALVSMGKDSPPPPNAPTPWLPARPRLRCRALRQRRRSPA